MEFLLRKLILTFIVLISTFILIIASTFAWFNNNSQAELSNMNFQVGGVSSLQFSLDGGNTWVTEFSGDDIYKALMEYYKSQNNSLSGLFYSKVADGNINNTKTVYGFRYQLVTPLPTQNGFVTKFYNMEQKVIDNRQTIIFNNLTDNSNPVITGSDETNYNYYDPSHGYIKFTFKVKSDTEVALYLKDCIISLGNNPQSNDYYATSVIRIGFVSEYMNDSHCDVTHNHDYSCRHLSVYEAVDDLTNDLIHLGNLPADLLTEIGGDNVNTYGRGYYFNKNYADKFTVLFSQENLVKEKVDDLNHYELDTSYNDGDYSLQYYKEALEKSKLNSLLEVNPTILLKPNSTPQDLTMYIWCEGWDGCSGNFAGLGSFNISFSFTGLPV